ncbi:MAG: matrixin family metalloprotease [Oligoflexales bacterium]
MGRYFYALIGWFLFQGAAWAYPTPVDFEGDLQRWDIALDDPVIYYFVKDEDGDGQDSYGFYVEQAAEKWTEVDSSYIVLERVAEEEDAQIVVNLKANIEESAFSSGFAAYTKEDDRLVRCEIEIMKSNSIGVEDFSKTALHELGHCVGLGHSLIPEAIMSYQVESNKFELDLDDIAGVSRLYPSDGSTPKIPKGCAVGPRGMTSSFTLAWFFVPLFLTIKRKRRRGSPIFSEKA